MPLLTNMTEALRLRGNVGSLLRASLASVAVALLLAGCASGVRTSDGPGIGVVAGGANYHFGSPSGCAGALADYRAVIDNDQRTGHLNQSVYRRIAADLESVRASCAAGRAPEANSRLAAVKSRYGYR